MKQELTDKTGFWDAKIFEKVKAYLRSATKDDPPVIGTSENFCEADPQQERKQIGMVVKTKPPKIKKDTKDATMEEVLSGTHTPGAADLVNKLIEDEANE